MKNRVGLFFGSFNPIHIGHLIIAEYLVENSDLEEIWFVISPNNPLKQKSSLLNEHQRFYMVQIAIENDSRFRACDVEFKLPIPSYTCTTLLKLNELYPNKKFSIIMGEDNLQCIEKWKNFEFILQNYRVLVYPRMGYQCDKVFPKANVVKVPAPRIELSATMIRESIRSGKILKYALPPAVERYIDEMNLYKK
ncbi:MAG: nicotinate-nucleotide adenylyltransferase [Bacteroidales bacterium]|nr:nicotinate-nucleotide adenylyltransferase [Bacteroidales bacterium]